MNKILVTPRSLTKGGDPALDLLTREGFELVFSTPGTMPPEDELIQLLQGVQNELGFVPDEALKRIAKFTGVAESRVYAVVTFYAQFRSVPIGRRHIVVCRGTACHIDGYKTLREELESTLDIKEGETTKDNRFTIIPVKCLGLCDKAPSMLIDHDTFERVTVKQLPEILNQYK